jgi:hypothetical protein
MSPVLIDREPVAPLLLTARTAYLVAVAHDVPFPVFIVVAAARLCAADPV